MVSRQTILMVPIRHNIKMARNLLDANPARGASFGMSDTGPTKKNLARLKEADKQLIVKEAMGMNSGLRGPMVCVVFPATVFEKNDDEAMIIAKVM